MRFGWRWTGPRRSIVFVPVLAVAATVAAALAPGPVSAHALLRASEPASGATLGRAPTEVRLTFSETPDLGLTSIRVLDSGGGDHVGGPIEALADPRDSVRAPMGELGDGVYTVSWRTVSSVDGHISAGSFTFGIGVAPPTGLPGVTPEGSSESGSPPGILARWLLYLGFVALVGAAFAAVAVARRQAPDLLAMAAVGWILTAVGTVGVVGVQWAETGAPIEQLPSTSIGFAALARLASLAVVAIALAALAVVPRLGARRGWAAVGLASAAAVAVDVATGHAAAGTGALPQVAVQSLHGVSAGAWVGGLAGLLVLLRTTPAGERLATARRFSAWAGWAIAVVALTGVVRAIAEIGTLEALIATDFGRVVIAKTALLLVLALLGAVNRFFTLRDARRVVGGLRRIGGLEIATAVAVLGLSGWLVNLTPPTSAGVEAPPVAPPIVATGHDFGTSVRLRLIAAPGPAGANDFDVALVDYDSDEPVDASAVELRFELASQAGVEPSTLDLARTAPGRFRGSGSNLSIDGIWRITATVATPTGGVEVPLLAPTSVISQPAETIVSPGLPTIYVVQLPSVGSAQVYLDPGGPGPNELHVTFFDPTGSELGVNTATIATSSAGGGAAIPTARRLEPGHFVASVEAVSGPLAVDAVGPLPGDAGPVHLRVTIEVQS